MSDCGQIVMSEIELVVEIPQSKDYLVEIENTPQAIEMQNCMNQLIEVEGESLHMEIRSCENFIIEIDRLIPILEFPDTVVIEGGVIPPVCDCAAVTEQYEAGEAVQVNRVISIMGDGRIKHADKDDEEEALDTIGVSKQSGSIGQLVNVVKFGKLTGASFGAVSENLFLGTNGQLLSVPPTLGVLLSIGVQTAGSEFHINIGEPIRRL